MAERPPPTGQKGTGRRHLSAPRSPLGTRRCPLKASPSASPSRPLLHAAPGTGAHGESRAPHRLPANEKIPPLSVSRTRPPETNPFVSSLSPAAAMRHRPTRDPGEVRLPNGPLGYWPEAGRPAEEIRRQRLLSLWEAPEESVGYRARNCHVSSWNGQKEEKVPQTKSALPTDCNFFLF